MDLNNYYYHGLQDSGLLKSIIKYGLLSRNKLIEKSMDSFSSSKDFINDKGTNGFDSICICTYNSLSYYLFSFPNISLIIKKDNNYDIEFGSLEGELLVKNEISKDNIIGIGIRIPRLTKYNKKVYEYILDIKNNYEIIKEYQIINLETGKKISEKEISKLFNYLNINKKINILIEGTIFSGKKDVLKYISDSYIVHETDDISINDSYDYKKELFIKRYNYELNNKDIVIYKDSLLDYKKVFNKEEWNNILNELRIKENDLKKNYDIIIHLYSMVNKNVSIYNNIPKCINDILKIDNNINKKWNNNLNYYKVLPKENINDKINELLKIIENYI